jgi:hypothetical protein
MRGHLIFLRSPDPSAYRQELPVCIRRAYECGEIGRAEVWRRLVRLWGVDEVAQFLDADGYVELADEAEQFAA